MFGDRLRGLRCSRVADGGEGVSSWLLDWWRTVGRGDRLLLVLRSGSRGRPRSRSRSRCLSREGLIGIICGDAGPCCLLGGDGALGGGF